MQVLIVAEHASTQFGGEAFLPLNYFRLLRERKIDTWLVVHQRTQTELESLFPEESSRMHFIADTWLHRLLCHLGKFLPRRLAFMTVGLISHLYTQSHQRRIVRELVKQNNIDVVHQPIPVPPKYPSLIYNVGAPVVIGPMNGGMDYPPSFNNQSWFVDFTMFVGRKLSDFVNYLMPGKLQANVLLVANERTKQALPAGCKKTILELVENGVDLSIWQNSKSHLTKTNQSTRFIFIGRLIDWKAVDLLLEAFSVVAANCDAHLEIIGDGKQRKQLEAQTVELDLSQKVTFSGYLSQGECAAKLEKADVFVLPSLLECGGAVVLEAMAMGIPVIATKWGGPVDYLDESCGILIEPTSKVALVNGLINAMQKLAQEPQLRLQLGEAAKERVRQYFDWERKIDRILEIYDLAKQK
ncbi:MAG: glycosyltransferase family 4 protein [Cyanobacteria bacterium P01_C01_bin.38]